MTTPLIPESPNSSLPPGVFAAKTIVPFIISSALTGALIIYWAFFSSSVLGLLLGWLIKLFLKSKGVVAHFDSINIAPLSGTIALKNIRFVNENYSIHAVDGFIRIRWWLQHVKQTLDGGRATRVQIELNGLDVQLYNNAERYKQLRRALFKTRGPSGPHIRCDSDGNPLDASDMEAIDLQELVPVNEFKNSFLQRLSPVLKIVVHKGSFVAGNPLINSLLSVSFHSARVKYTTEPATHPTLDYYKTRIRADLSHVTLHLTDNALYHEKNHRSDTHTQPSDTHNKAPRQPGFLNFLRTFNFGFMKDIGISTEPLLNGQMENGVDSKDDTVISDENASTLLLGTTFDRKRYRQLKKIQEAILASTVPQFSAPSMRAEFYADFAGPYDSTVVPTDDDVSDSADDEKFNINAPQQGLIVTAPTAVLNFGPTAFRHRVVLQGFFWPAMPPIHEPPRQRQFNYFDVDVRVTTTTTLRVPFRAHGSAPPAAHDILINGLTAASNRRSSKNAGHSELLTEDGYEWLEIFSGPVSFGHRVPQSNKLLNRMQIKIDPDYVESKAFQPDFDRSSSVTSSTSNSVSSNSDTTQSRAQIEMDAMTDKSDPRVLIVSSLHPKEHWMHVSNIILDVTIETSDIHTEIGKWIVDAKISDSCVFFLRDHADFFARLGQDFAAPGFQFGPTNHAEALAHFRPTIYEVNLHFIDQYAIHLNLNERNVVDEISNMLKNNYYSFMGPKLLSNIEVSLASFQQAYLPITFEASTENLSLMANYCEQSTMRHLYEPSNEDELSNFLFARILRLSGGMQYATGNGIILPVLPNMDHEQLIDYLDLKVEANEVRGKCVGTHLNQFDRFLDNYVGAHTKTTRSDELLNVDPTLSPRNKPAENTGDLQRRMEIAISVCVRHPTVSLPFNLYNDQISAVVKCKEVNVDVRVGPELTLTVGVSPVTVYLPPCGCTVVSKPMATLSRLSVELMYRKAKYVDSTGKCLDLTYRQFFKIILGDVKLAVEPVQVLRALDGVKEMFYTLFNRDNRPDYLPQLPNPYELLKHYTLFLSLNSVDAKIWGPRGVIQATLQDGMKLAIDNLCTPRHREAIRLRLPNVKLSILTPTSVANKSMSSGTLPETEDWMESAAFFVPKVILSHIDALTDPSQKLHIKQLQFLRKCDETRHRLLPYIWQDDKVLWSVSPLGRPWIRNFFDPPVTRTFNGESGDTLSLVNRIFAKTNPLQAPKPNKPTANAKSELVALKQPSFSQPLKRTGSKTASSWRSLSRPEGPASPVLTIDTPGERTTNHRAKNSSSISPTTPRSPKPLLSSSNSSSDTEFSTAHSSEDFSEATKLKRSVGALSSGASPSQIPKVTFELPISEATRVQPIVEVEEEVNCTEMPVQSILDHFSYDILDSSVFTETDQLGEFQAFWKQRLEMCDDSSLVGSGPVASLSPKSGATLSPPPMPQSMHSEAPQEVPSSSTPSKHERTKSKKRSLRSRHSLRHSNTREDASKTHHSSHSEVEDPAINLDDVDDADPYEASETATLFVKIPELVTLHVTPAAIVTVADAIDNFARERITVQTLLDRIQLGLVSQMVVDTKGAGILKFQAVMVQISGARLNLLQTHIGEVLTNYVTSFALGKVTVSMKSSQERIRPANFANMHYELPALVDSTKSRDLSITIATFMLSAEQISGTYAEALMSQYQKSCDAFKNANSLNDDIPLVSPESVKGGDPGASPKPDTQKMDENNSRFIFNAKLLDPLEVLYRFVAPSYLATREAATHVKVGMLQGVMNEEFGAYIASMVRSWSPSISFLTSVASGLTEKGRLARLVLYELLVQLRDVEVNHDPYAAFGRSSEANRTAWMLVYVTRQRLMNTLVRGLSSENRIAAGQVCSTTIVSVDSVRAFEQSIGQLLPHHMPPLLAGCIDLDFYLHNLLSKDPDIVGSHFLVNELFLKRAQTTRQRFTVHISGVSIKLPSIAPTTALSDDMVRSAIILLPVDVSALTKVSVRLPPSDVARPTSSPVSPQPVRTKMTSSVAEDLFISSSDAIGASFSTFANLRVLAPVTVSETQFLVNSKGVQIHVTPKVLEIGQAALKRWKASEELKHTFEVRSLNKFTFIPVRFALLEQMIEVSPDIFQIPSHDREAISGHLVSDAFSVRALSRFGTVALDIPETTLTLSSLPVSSNGARPASHTVILRLPVLRFAANIERRKRSQLLESEFDQAPINLELSQFSACLMLTPSGITLVDVGGTTQEVRQTGAQRAIKRSTKHSNPASPYTTMRADKERTYDALDVVIHLASFTLPFRMPNPIYAQSFLNEWTPTQSTRSTSSNSAQSKLKPSTIVVEPLIESKSRPKSKIGEVDEQEDHTIPFFNRKVRSTFHAHLENITLAFTQLQLLPVKYEIPELAILSRHAEHEHALRVSVKSHSISFEPKKSKVSVDSEDFDFVSKKVTKFELPPWTIESTVRQYYVSSPDGDGAKTKSKSRRKDKTHSKPKLHTDIQSSLSVHYIQNVLRAKVIKNILVFQATMRREIDSVIAILEEAKKKKKVPTSLRVEPQDAELTPSPDKPKDALAFFRMWPNVRWRMDVDWKGMEVQIESPHATIMLYTGHLRGAVSSMKRSETSLDEDSRREPSSSSRRNKKRDRDSQPSSAEHSDLGEVPKSTSQNPFELKVTVSYITALLCPPGTKSKVWNKTLKATETGKLDVWAGLSTNLAIQTFPDRKFKFVHSGAAQRGAFKSWWILLHDTHALIQPWVGEKALLMWLYFSEYHSTITSRKSTTDTGDATTRQSSLDLLNSTPSPSPPVPEPKNEPGSMLEGTDANIFVQISVVGVLVPCNSIKGATSRLPLGIANDPRFNLNSALILRLERFTFSGSARTSGRLRGTSLLRLHSPHLVKPKRTKVLANAVLTGLSAGFDCLEYNDITLNLEDDSLYKPPSMNTVVISNADCSFVFVKEAKPQAGTGQRSSLRYGPSSLTGAVEMRTDGLKFKFNAQLYSHASILVKCVELGQKQFSSILEELNRAQMKAEKSTTVSAPTTRRPRGGTISIRGPGVLEQLVRPSSANLSPSPTGSLKQQQQTTFQLDVTLVTTAGALEFYSCTSAAKADNSGETLKPVTKKGRKVESVPLPASTNGLDASDSEVENLLAGAPLNLGDDQYGHNYGDSSRHSHFPAKAPKRPSYTLLVTIPLPQARASYSKLYTSRAMSYGSPALSRPNLLSKPVSSGSKGSTEGSISKRMNSNTIAVSIGSLNCVISPDMVIFYHELLAQISVIKLVLQDPEQDEEQSNEEDGDDLSNLFDSSESSANPSKTSNDANPAQPADKYETWTVHFHLLPSSLALSSTPYSETVCAFKTGDIIVMYQSAFMKPDQGKEPGGLGIPMKTHSGTLIKAAAFQRSVLLDIGSLLLIMDHPHIDKDTKLASFEIGSFRLHGSHTEIMSPPSTSGSQTPTASDPLTLLMTVQSCTGFFSIRHLQEILLFANVWQQGIYLSQYSDFFGTGSNSVVAGQTGSSEMGDDESDLPSTANDDSESSTTSSINANGSSNIGVLGLLLDKSSILLNVEIHHLNFVSDLGPSLASVTCNLEYAIGSLSAPGRSKVDPLGEIYDLVLQAGPLDVVFRGTLDGSIKLPLIAMHGRRLLSADPTKPVLHRAIIPHAGKRRGIGSSPLNKTGTIFDRPNLVGRSIWTGNVSPIDMSLNYSHSPVLVVSTGDVVIAAYDTWRRKERDEDDDEDVTEDDSLELARMWEAVTNVNATLGSVDLSISSETISLPTSVAKRLIDNIRKSNEKAKSTLKSMDQLLVVRRDLRKMKFQAGVGMKPLARLQHLKSMAHNAHKTSFRTGSIPHHDSALHQSRPTGGQQDVENSSGLKQPPSTTNKDSTDCAAGTPLRRRRIAIGEVKFTGNALNVRMFSFSLRDPTWFDLSVTSFQIGLVQRTSKIDLSEDSSSPELVAPNEKSILSGSSGSVIRRISTSQSDSLLDSSTLSANVLITVSRELSLVIGGASLSKFSESRSMDQYNRSEQMSDSVFLIPATTLIQHSSQDLGSNEVVVYFMATFGDAIRVAIKLALYTELKDTVASYRRAIDASKNAIILPQRILANKGDGIGQNRGTTASALRSSRKKSTSSAHNRIVSGTAALPDPTSTATARLPKITISKPIAQPATPAAAPSESKDTNNSKNNATEANSNETKRVFIIKKFDFDPSIDVLGDFTPRIATVLGWIGIKDGEKTIPKAVHKLTDVLESTLTQVTEASRRIKRQRTQWKSYSPGTPKYSMSQSPSSSDV